MMLEKDSIVMNYASFFLRSWLLPFPGVVRIICGHLHVLLNTVTVGFSMALHDLADYV